MSKLISILASVSKTIADTPTAVLTPSVVGVSAISAYYNIVISDVIAWFSPCLFVIIADLLTGLRLAIEKGERVTFSTALRRTISKIVAYGCWTIFAVTIGHNTGWNNITIVAMGIILFIEGSSCISNILNRNGGNNPLKYNFGRQLTSILLNKLLGTNIKADDLNSERGYCGNNNKENNNGNNKKGSQESH